MLLPIYQKNKLGRLFISRYFISFEYNAGFNYQLVSHQWDFAQNAVPYLFKSQSSFASIQLIWGFWHVFPWNALDFSQHIGNDNNIAITCFSPSIDLNYYTLIWMLFIETQLFSIPVHFIPMHGFGQRLRTLNNVQCSLVDLVHKFCRIDFTDFGKKKET